MEDGQAFERINGDGTRGLLLLADHATSIVPAPYANLGLPDQAFRRHIAYDIGIEPLTRLLAARLEVPAVLSRFSRLLIDPNRGEDDPTLIMQISDGAIIPGNHPLSDDERESRLDRFHRPYHRAVDAAIADVTAKSGSPPLIISLHSYTPEWKGVARPWHAAVLWDADHRPVAPLIAALAASGEGLLIGDNEPYDGALRGDTLYRHCMTTGIAHALIEIRQDLIADEAGAALWADRLVPILSDLNARPDLHQHKRFASRTGPYET